MYTNMLQNEVNGGVLIYDISDHLPIFSTVLVKPQHKLRSIKKLVRNLKKFDKNKFVGIYLIWQKISVLMIIMILTRQ